MEVHNIYTFCSLLRIQICTDSLADGGGNFFLIFFCLKFLRLLRISQKTAFHDHKCSTASFEQIIACISLYLPWPVHLELIIQTTLDCLCQFFPSTELS